MGQVPPKYFTPSAPYGSSEAANTVNQANPAAVNPQTPLLPPNFTDPGKMQTTQQSTPLPSLGGSSPNSPNFGQNQWGKMFGKLFILFLFLPSLLFATTTVTGKIQNLGTGNMTNGAFVRFWLRGCAGNQPRINGTSVIGPSQGGVYFFDIAADASGNISGTIYSTRDSTGNGNGDIECGGSLTAVWYGMQIFVAGKGGPETPIHAKSGSTLDITQVTPITTNPVVTSPTGDSTYLRLDGGNSPVTGNIQFNGSVQGTLTSTGTIVCTVVNAIPCVSSANPQGWAGTDIGGWINAAYASCSSAAGSGGCRIQIASNGSCYSFATPIVFATQTKPVLVEGSPGTCLIYTPTSGTAITFNVGGGVAGPPHMKGYGLRNISLNGPNGGLQVCASLSGVTATGLLLGGTNGAEGFSADGVNINCFNTDVLYGNNTFGTSFTHFTIRNANTLVNFPVGLTQSGEEMSWTDGHFFNNIDLTSATFGSTGFTCGVNLNVTATDHSFKGVSFDSAQLCVTNPVVHLSDVHFENSGPTATYNVPFINVVSGSLYGNGVKFFQDNVTPVISPSAYIVNSGTVVLDSFITISSVNLTYLVQDSGSGITFIKGNLGSNAFTNTLNHTGGGNYLIDVSAGGGTFISPTSLKVNTFLLAQVIGSGNVTTAGTLISAGTCQAQTGISIANSAVTDSVTANIGAALPATWQTGIVLSAHVTTSGTVTAYLCNPTAGGITPAATQVNVKVLR